MSPPSVRTLSYHCSSGRARVGTPRCWLCVFAHPVGDGGQRRFIGRYGVPEVPVGDAPELAPRTTPSLTRTNAPIGTSASLRDTEWVRRSRPSNAYRHFDAIAQ